MPFKNIEVQNYLVDISTPKPRHTIMFQIQTKLGSLKEQMELDLLTPFSKIRDGRAGSVWLYDYMPELKKDIISVLPTIMQESSFWWEYCSEYWRNCSLSLWMETSQRQELGQTLSLRTVLKTWSVKNQKTSRSFWRDEALFARRQVGSGHGNQEVLSLARAAFPLALSREFDWI